MGSPIVVTLTQQQCNVGEKPIVILYTSTKNLNASRPFEHFSVLVAHPKKLLYTVANPARGLLNREIYTGVSYARKGEKMTLFLSSFAPENVVSRDRSGGPVPRQPVAHSPHSRLNVVLTYGVRPYTVLPCT